MPFPLLPRTHPPYKSQPRNHPPIQHPIHLPPRPIRIQARIRPRPLPRPLALERRLQRALEHLHHVLAEHGEEFPAVEVAAGGDEEGGGGCGVRGDDEVG